VTIICDAANQTTWLHRLQVIDTAMVAALGSEGVWECHRNTEIHTVRECKHSDQTLIRTAQKARAKSPQIWQGDLGSIERAIYCHPQLAEDRATYQVTRGSRLMFHSDRMTWPELHCWTQHRDTDSYSLSIGQQIQDDLFAVETYRMEYSHPSLTHPLMFVPARDGLFNEMANQSWACDRAMCYNGAIYLTPSGAIALSAGIVHAPHRAMTHEIAKVARRGYRVYHSDLLSWPEDVPEHELLLVNRATDPPQYQLPATLANLDQSC